MNVKELKAKLDGLPDDMVIYVSSDSEGNRYTTLDFVDPTGMVMDDDGYTACIVSTDWTADEAMEDEADWELMKLKCEKCVVFYP